MSRIYLETDEELEDKYKKLSEALDKMLSTNVDEYTIGDRTLKRVAVAEYRRELRDIAAEVQKRKYGRGVRTQRIIPVPDK